MMAVVDLVGVKGFTFELTGQHRRYFAPRVLTPEIPEVPKVVKEALEATGVLFLMGLLHRQQARLSADRCGPSGVDDSIRTTWTRGCQTQPESTLNAGRPGTARRSGKRGQSLVPPAVVGVLSRQGTVPLISPPFCQWHCRANLP
jgi:hypothetical protein